MKRASLILVVPAVAALVAACGGGSGSGGAAAVSSGGWPAPNTAAAAPSSGGAAVIKTSSDSLGTYLTDGSGNTLYLWQGDSGTTSACTGDCAAAWPPLTTDGAPRAKSGVKATLLGTTKRADGTLQVTYAGHPLYRFASDAGPGDVNGEGSPGFGAPWYVVAPGGKPITG